MKLDYGNIPQNLPNVTKYNSKEGNLSVSLRGGNMEGVYDAYSLLSITERYRKGENSKLVLVHRSILDQFLYKCTESLSHFYGNN